jgi:hypothetical protein
MHPKTANWYTYRQSPTARGTVSDRSESRLTAVTASNEIAYSLHAHSLVPTLPFQRFVIIGIAEPESASKRGVLSFIMKKIEYERLKFTHCILTRHSQLGNVVVKLFVSVTVPAVVAVVVTVVSVADNDGESTLGVELTAFVKFK